MGLLSYQVARVWGIPIRLHVSLVFTLLYFINRFGVIAGTLMEAGFAASIVLHELGHSLVAIRKGCRVRSITLLFLGGAAQMDNIPTRPGDEFLMSIAGPGVSILLGILLLTAGHFLPTPGILPGGIDFLTYMGAVNLILAGFNLIPAFPMDGGRVLRAFLARRMGRVRATFIAARLGRALAVIFGLSGFFGVPGLVAPQNWVMIAIAFFVFISAGNEYRMAVIHEQMNAMYGAQGGGEVVISPPPYEEDRPPERTEINSDRKNNPFWRFR